MQSSKEFYHRLFKIAGPIALQSLVMASLNLVDVLMIGQLGDNAVASVGLANQIYFLLTFLLYGISNGAGVFTAQLWGKQDIPNIRKVQGLSLLMALVGGLGFAVLAVLFPRVALGFYSQDPNVLDLGSGYLQIVGLSYVFTAITYCYASVLKSTGNVRLPMAASMIALSFKAILSYGLIFGVLGLPAWGVKGAAIATCLARTLECAIILGVTYRKRLPAAARLGELTRFSRAFSTSFLKVAFPVVLNESLWSLGISTYNMVYAHISTEAIAAVNIASTIESMAYVLFIGLSDGCAIMIGNNIGEDQPEKAFQTAKRVLIMTIAGAILMGGLIYLSSEQILALYKVSDIVQTYARNILYVIAAVLWVRVTNMTIIAGILRSGGDTRYSFFVDVGTVWLVGIPMAVIGGFLLHLEVYWVYLMITCEEVAKFLVGMHRVASKKWMNNLVHEIQSL